MLLLFFKFFKLGVVDFKTLCNCIDYSERYIKDLKKQGAIVSTGTNKYKLEEFLINVQKYLKELIEKEKEIMFRQHNQ